MKKILFFLIAINLFANPQFVQMKKSQLEQKPQMNQSADELLMNEIEGLLGKLDKNSNQIQNNISEIKRLKRANRDIQRDNSDLLSNAHTKCKALKILNSDIAQSICKKIDSNYKSMKDKRGFFIKLNDNLILKRYPHITKRLFNKSKHVEFMISKENGAYFAKRRGYSIPISESNRVEDGMFIMIKEQDNKFYTTAYKHSSQGKWNLIK